MESSTPEVQIKRIVLSRMRRCAVCHRDYVDGDIRVVSRQPEMWMMVVECDECHARNFVAAVLNDGDPDEAKLALRQLSEDAQHGITAEGIIEGEGAEVTDRTPISAGEVVDMHEFLSGFDGDFHRLFTSSRRE